MARYLLICALWLGWAQAAPTVKMTTTLGDITIELDEVKAPNTTANFLKYVRSGFYDGTIFHRVIPGFVIQGGGYDRALERKFTQDPIANEAHNGLKNTQYTLSMARTSNPHSATSQFFINLVDNPMLDPQGSDPHGYAVFGRVSAGQDVVQKTAAVPTTNAGGMSDVPTTAVEITKAVVVEDSQNKEPKEAK